MVEKRALSTETRRELGLNQHSLGLVWASQRFYQLVVPSLVQYICFWNLIPAEQHGIMGLLSRDARFPVLLSSTRTLRCNIPSIGMGSFPSRLGSRCWKWPRLLERDRPLFVPMVSSFGSMTWREGFVLAAGLVSVRHARRDAGG